MSNSSPNRVHAWFGLTLCAAFAFCGCITTYDSQAQRDTERREDHLLMMKEVRSLEGRLEGLDMEVDALNRNVDGVSRSATQGARAESQSLRSSITRLEARVSALESARARDREEIINHLTRKISELMGSRPETRTSTSSRGASSEYGYEHVVKAGENLSRIAAAYGVSVKSIVDANKLSSPDQVREGQTLFIPE